MSVEGGRYFFDVEQPHPNVDIDTLRRYVLDFLAGIAAAQESAAEAMTTARNARQMVLNRDPRFDTLEERYQALVDLTDQLQALAGSYESAVTTSVTDRARLHELVAALGTRVDAAQISARTAVDNADALQKALAVEVARAKAAEQVTADAVAALAARVTVLEGLRLRGTTGTAPAVGVVAAGTQTVAVTFATPMPTANYTALVSLDTNATVQLGSVSPVYPVTNKTKTGCSVTLRNSGLSLISNVVVQVVALDLA